MERCTSASQAIWSSVYGSPGNDVVEGFTKKYGVHALVYYELHGDMERAIIREKRLKKWNRSWKLRLIEKANPDWDDLYESIL